MTSCMQLVDVPLDGPTIPTEVLCEPIDRHTPTVMEGDPSQQHIVLGGPLRVDLLLSIFGIRTNTFANDLDQRPGKDTMGSSHVSRPTISITFITTTPNHSFTSPDPVRLTRRR